MIEVQEAITKVLSTATSFGVEQVSIDKTIGRVLAENIYADRAFPPFDRVTMDGIAINYDSYKKNNRTFTIECVAPAGSPQQTLKDTDKCIEIMTGASLPLNTDTIIRYEDLEKTESGYQVVSDVKQGQNVHSKESDVAKDTLLLATGHTIKAIDVNVLASVGYSKIKVKLLPKVAVLSSGDELVDIDQEPLPHQIRKSNAKMLTAHLYSQGIVANAFHLKDEKKSIIEALQKIIKEHDVVLMSGGVSKGKFDFIPDALAEIGVQKLFHRVAQRPGKPLWFGQKDKKVVFAFPGNPVSTISCYIHYFLPWLKESIGIKTHILKYPLIEDIFFKPDLTLFAPVKIITEEKGIPHIKVIKTNGSGDMVGPTKADGFVTLPKGKNEYKKGEYYIFHPF